MLKGIDPRLDAELLYVLRAMGHGDTLVLADTNFPAEALAPETVHGVVVPMQNIGLSEAAEAILSLMPLDTFVEDFAMRMEVVGDPFTVPSVQAELQGVIDAAEGRARPMVGLERFAFYEAAKRAFAVVQTGERRFYGDAILRMGVIPPEDPA